MRKKYFTEEERKQALRDKTKKYYNSDKGHERTLNYNRNYRALNKNKIATNLQVRRKTKAGYADRFMERLKLRTPDTDIDRGYLMSVFNDNCAITNRPFEYEKTYNSYHNALAPSIDRIDSKIGYYKGNIQIVLSCINRMKNDMPNPEFLELWKVLTE